MKGKTKISSVNNILIIRKIGLLIFILEKLNKHLKTFFLNFKISQIFMVVQALIILSVTLCIITLTATN